MNKNRLNRLSGTKFICGIAATLALAMIPVRAAQPPPVPYYSLQLATLTDEASTKSAVEDAIKAGHPFVRGEKSGKYYAVRIGAWISRAEVQANFEQLRDRGINTAIIEVTEDKPWLFVEGPAGNAAPAAKEPAEAVAETAAPAKEPPAAPEPEKAAAPRPAAKAAQLPPAAPNPGVWWRTSVVSLASIGYEEGFFIEGAEGSREMYLPVPPGVDPTQSEVVLDVKFGESLIAESSYQFSINDTPRRTVRRGDAGGGNLMQVTLPLSERDVLESFVKLRVNFTQLLDKDICFSRELAGAWTRFSPGSGLMVLKGTTPPSTVRAAWSLLPEEVVISADFSQVTPSDYQAMFHLATLLNDDQRKFRFEHLPADASLKDVHGHIVLGTRAQLKQWGADDGASPASANLRLASAMTNEPREQDRERRVFIFVDRERPLEAGDMLRMPWRRASGARLLDVKKAVEWPIVPDNPETVRLEELGFGDSERRFSYTTDWKIGLPFGPMGLGNRPDRIQLIVYSPETRETRRATVLSAYYNDRLVYSGALEGKSEAQTLAFDLPRHLLRARNRLQIVAQRDELADRCSQVQAAQPMSISPSSPIRLRPINETPQTFAELVPQQRALAIYAGTDAMASAATTIPALVALGRHFWPDVPPPRMTFFKPGESIEPSGPFFVIGAPGWKPESFVRFDQGRIRVVSNATQQEAVALDFASDVDWSVLQMARVGEHAGAWLRTGGGYANLPTSRRHLLLEDENVALLDGHGLQMGLRVGAERDYEVEYPEATTWFSASDRVRTLLFVLLWVLGAALIIYLLRQSRRHRTG